MAPPHVNPPLPGRRSVMGVAKPPLRHARCSHATFKATEQHTALRAIASRSQPHHPPARVGSFHRPGVGRGGAGHEWPRPAPLHSMPRGKLHTCRAPGPIGAAGGESLEMLREIDPEVDATTSSTGCDRWKPPRACRRPLHGQERVDVRGRNPAPGGRFGSCTQQTGAQERERGGVGIEV